MTTIGAHIMSKFQLCTPSISEVIAKSVLGGSFQNPLQEHTKRIITSTTEEMKFIKEVTTIGAHMVSQFQLCTPSISKVSVKSVLIGFFQDPSQNTHKPL